MLHPYLHLNFAVTNNLPQSNVLLTKGEYKFFSMVKIEDWMETNDGKTRRKKLNVKVTTVGTVTACGALN
jgi:phage pi2 protein 07